jgi:hypothetical protein
MAFTGNYSCNTLRTGLMNGTMNFSSDVFKLALYTNTATLNAETSGYSATGEASGGNYSAGGQTVAATVSTAATTTGSTVYVSFAAPAWTGAITARGALIYNNTTGDAVCVLDFGSDKTSTSTFTVAMPANTSTSALIRLV